MSPSQYAIRMAVHDFQSARKKAGVQEILARLSGRSNRLLSYDEIARKLKLNVRTERGLKHIPIDSIVGSVSRATDFTRTFLPRRGGDQERWATVKAAQDTSGVGLLPIEVYQVAEVYFVIDGNHRVSIARQEKIPTIEAHVIEVQTPVPLTPDMQPAEMDRLIIQAERIAFMQETGLEDLRPNVDLSVTTPYQYEKMLEQIRLHHYLLEQDGSEKSSFQDAVLDWYDHAYIPLVEAVRDRGLMRWFPDRTITDFYLWICEYHAELQQETGWELNPETAASALTSRESSAADRHETAAGGWRESRLVERYTDRLFNDILVPISGDQASWQSLEQAILIARHEESSLHGLHIVSSPADLESPAALQVRDRFNERCAQAGLSGSLVIEEADIVDRICERTRLADLTVLKIVNPPMGGLASLRSPFRSVISCSNGPILGLTGDASPLDRALIAFDDSPRAREALFVGAYLGERWHTSITVFTALENGRLSASIQDYARRYLELHEVEAEYILSEGSAHALKQALADGGYNLLLLGSYGSSALREVFIGSTLDFALRGSPAPVFICR
jgi:nucleotide-binding universal stress UspA family protein